MFAKALSRYWWVALIRGIVAILFGLLAFAMPGTTLASLVLLFGAFALIEGALAIGSAIAARGTHEDWWILLLEGLLGVAFGLIALARPGITSLVLLYYIAAWAIVVGAMRIATAIRLRRELHGEGWLAFGGVISILFGVLMFASPASGALALILYIGAWAIIEGASLCALSFRLKRLGSGRAEDRPIPPFGVPAR